MHYQKSSQKRTDWRKERRKLWAGTHSEALREVMEKRLGAGVGGNEAEELQVEVNDP